LGESNKEQEQHDVGVTSRLKIQLYKGIMNTPRNLFCCYKITSISFYKKGKYI